MNFNSLMIPVGLGLSALAFGSSLALAQPPSLGAAQSFAVLGGTTVTNIGATTVAGDLGVSPGDKVTGFPPGILQGTLHAGDPVALQAQGDLTTAYNACAGAAVTATLTGRDLGGLTLTPGVYFFAASAPLNGVLTLDAQGNHNAVFIFQIGTTLLPASNSSVNVINGAKDANVFWQVGSSAVLAAGVVFRGNILALASITLSQGTQVNGRALARTGAVTMDASSVNTPATYTVFGLGCTGSAGIPALAAASGSLPWINGNFTTEVTKIPVTSPVVMFFGASNTMWGAIPLPFKLDALGMAGCSLLASPDTMFAMTNNAGTASLTFTLPNDSGLVGVSFHNQGWVYDPPANRLGWTTSNGATATIGKK